MCRVVVGPHLRAPPSLRAKDESCIITEYNLECGDFYSPQTHDISNIETRCGARVVSAATQTRSEYVLLFCIELVETLSFFLFYYQNLSGYGSPVRRSPSFTALKVKAQVQTASCNNYSNRRDDHIKLTEPWWSPSAIYIDRRTNPPTYAAAATHRKALWRANACYTSRLLCAGG
ncbi:hypothetical protein C8R44DRAFT_728313 [Mycena epipterygia]|nr:hypothetical protein C8R44DRAFT_728313 [Mycena epipterygia]